MTEICDRLLRAGGPAVLFERPAGFRSPDGIYSVPVLANLFGTTHRVALGMGAQSLEDLRDIGRVLSALKEPEPPRGLREAGSETREERAADRSEAGPALLRALGEAGVDEELRDAARRKGKDRRRPQLGFDEEGEVGPPMVEEPADPWGDVERRELMHRPGREAAGGDGSGGDGSRGEDDGVAGRDEAVDEGHNRVGLADACGVDPDQPAG